MILYNYIIPIYFVFIPILNYIFPIFPVTIIPISYRA